MRAPRSCSPGWRGATCPCVRSTPCHEWYRLHGLFREMLQTHLRRSEPEIAPVLHRRAAAWYGRAGNVERALDHAAERGRSRQRRRPAVAEPARLSRRRTQRDGPAVAERQSRSTGSPDPPSSRWQRRTAIWRGDASPWRSSGLAARRSRLVEWPEHITEPERAAALIVDAWAARAGAARMGQVAAQAYELLPDDSAWQASCCLLRGTAALLTGDETEAELWLEEGAVRGAVLAPDTASLCLAQLAVVATERTEMDSASDFAQRARAVIEHARSVQHAGLRSGLRRVRGSRHARGPCRRGQG